MAVGVYLLWRSRKRIAIISLTFVLFWLLILCFVYFSLDPLNSTSITDEDELIKQPTEIVNNRRIFFHETSGRNWLDLRQTCAVESAAKNNPQRPVQLFMSSSSDILMNSTWMNVLNNYENVRVIVIHDANYFKSTPLEDWYREGLWRTSPYRNEHFSDYIRMLSIYKGGGHYFDLDFITLKRLDEKLFNNFFCMEEIASGSLTGSTFHLDHGHRLIHSIIRRLASFYRPTLWPFYGPDLVTEVLTEFCNFNRQMGPSSNRCSDLRILAHDYFFPIGWQQWDILFINLPSTNDRSFKNRLSHLLKNSYATHVWNKMSSNTTLKVGSNQVYWHLARQHCPITLSHATEF